ncbi:hypothetical protein DFQ30_002307 [Apophysomyces sp. BC1015]|nr:hypothetical protein DFQ30_002307 [Apophysomyces sp. BC1015]
MTAGPVRMQVREVATPAARDTDLLRDSLRVVDQHDATPQLAGDRGTHHAGGTGANHRNIKMFHGAHSTGPHATG